MEPGQLVLVKNFKCDKFHPYCHPQQCKVLQQDQICWCQHFTEYQLLENQYDAIGKDLWKQLKRVSIPIFDGIFDGWNYNNWKVEFMACIDQAVQLQQNTSFYNFNSTFQEKSKKPLRILATQLWLIK